MVRRGRGIVLFLTLLLVIVVAMVARALVVLGPGSLARSQKSALHRAAARAADSGLDYAAARLRENPAWRGDGNAVMVDRPGLFVLEQSGNVVGLITERDGAVSQFRIRFNYQDGGPAEDGFDDPPAAGLIDSPYVSVNNLTDPASRVVPRAESGSWAVVRPDQGPYEVPGNTAAILVEGRAGPGVADLSSSNPNGAVGGVTATAVSEANFEVTLGQAVADASLMGGGDIEITVRPGQSAEIQTRRFQTRLKRRANAVPPRLRSKGSVVVQHPDGTPAPLVMEDGEVGRDAGRSPGFSAVTGSVTLKQENVGDGQDFYNLRWDQVTQADSDPATDQAVQIAGGTYVCWEDFSVHYYDMRFDDYRTFMSSPANQADPGVVLSDNLAEVRTATNLGAVPDGLRLQKNVNGKTVWEINEDLYVAASDSGLRDLAIIPREGAAIDPGDSDHAIPLEVPDSFSPRNIRLELTRAVASVPGDALLVARIRGKDATLTAEGELVAISPRANLEGKGNNSPTLELNLYAKGDLTFSTFNGIEFEDVDFSGIVYTWGDFRGVAAGGGAEGGRFDLEGALVAYGSDPVSGSPGSGGRGSIRIRANRVRVKWDERKVAGLLDFLYSDSAADVRRTLYHAR